MNKTEPQPLNVLLDKEAHRYAEQFAAEQATLHKGKQVYLNTLAVCAVHRYLKWLSVRTRLDRGDCWHPGLRAIFNVADLVLPNIGKLECRPLLPGEEALVLPPEVSDNRIGYVAVRLSESLKEGQLLGFLPASAISKPLEPIASSKLQSLDSLIDSIHWRRMRISLGQWFEGIFQEEWQPLPMLLATSRGFFRYPQSRSSHELESSYRSVSRGKVLRWWSSGTEQAIILVVKVTEKSTEEVDLRLLLSPAGDAAHLPSGLQAIVLDESGLPCIEAQARDADNWIELAFRGQPQDQFSIEIVLGEITITEQFII